MYISIRRLAAVIAASPSLFALVHGQTWSECNPMEKSDCPPDPALGGNYEHTFGGEAPSFKAVGSSSMIKYEGDAAHFIVEKSGDSPTLASNFYIMYGKLDVTMRAAPGKGIVSSLVFQSDVLDEIDWEWIGSDQGQAQSNYFGKGNTETYDRGGFHPVNHQEFHDYGVEWTPEHVQWLIDGQVVRTLTPDQVKGDFYPQTPMQIKIGSWSAGDPSNAPGVIEWAQGPTDYKAGPFDMIVKNIRVMDYSTGKFYVYTDNSGSAASIKSEGGKINSGPSDKKADPVDPKEDDKNDDKKDDDKKDEDKKDDDQKGGKSTFKAPVNSGPKTSTSSSTSTAPTSTTTKSSDNKDSADDKGKESRPTPTTSSPSSSASGSGQELVESGSSKPDESSIPKDSDGSGNRLGLATIPVLALAGLVGVGLVL